MLHTKTISPVIHSGVRITNRPDLENACRLDRAAFPMIVSMEHTGMRVDKTHMFALNGLITSEMDTLQRRVTELTGFEINLGSGDQLSDLLFKRLKLKQNGREKWTKSRARLAADSDVLKAMVSQHPSIRVILDWKEREKLRSTYTLSLIAEADSDDRIHTDFSSTTAETGRLTSSRPNLQNIPIRTKLGREIRNAFIPRKGNRMGTVDASQIEMRVHAHDSQCPRMMDIFWAGEDLYWATAEFQYNQRFTKEQRKCKCGDVHVPNCPAVFRCPGNPCDGLTFKDYYRFNAKTTTLMVSYDTSPGGLLDQFLITGSTAWMEEKIGRGVDDWDEDDYSAAEELCGGQITGWFAVYREILIRRKVHHRRAVKHRFVWDMFGGIRRIPQVQSTLKWIVAEGLRAAGNMPIQGAAAGIIKLWMAVVWERVESYWGRFGIEVLVQVHDELVSEGPESPLTDFLRECVELLRKMLEPFVDYFTVPLDGSWAIGDRWGDLEK